MNACYSQETVSDVAGRVSRYIFALLGRLAPTLVAL